jgi:hypothetical protein
MTSLRVNRRHLGSVRTLMRLMSINLIFLFVGYVLQQLITLTWKIKCLKSLNICFSCFLRRREIEFALAHRRLSFQCSSLLCRSVFKMAAIQWVTISVSNNLFICQRILARFSVDFGFILLCTFLEVDWVGFFSCNVSGNAISRSPSFSNFIRLMRSHGM